MTSDQIKAIFLANGFKEKDQGDGRMDLNPYVYDAVRALLAEQPQGEPVTLPSCKAKLSMSHDWDQGYSDGWKACLDESAKLGPLYTHADPGEIERLREATAYVQRMVDCAGTQPSVATGYLRDILDVLKGSAAPSAPTCGHAACKSLGEPHPFCEFAQGLDATGAAKQ